MDGRLGEVFVDVFAKRLAATEIRALGVSKSQAIQVGGATRMLGEPVDKEYFECRFIRVTDDDEPMEATDRVTLTDPRRASGRSPEWRLNYGIHQSVMAVAQAGDHCWIARLREHPDRLVMVLAPAGAEVAQRLDRLMGTGLGVEDGMVLGGVTDFTGGDVHSKGSVGIDVVDAELLSMLGVPVTRSREHLLGPLLDRFRGLPTSPKSGMVSIAAFTTAVMEVTPDVDPRRADEAIQTWVEAAYELFLLYEVHVRQPELDAAFANRASIDFAEFVEMAKKVINTRKSRAGGTLELYIAEVLRANGVAFTAGAVVGDKLDGTKPDFVLPSFSLYSDVSFPSELLTYLGSKTSTKERWMQVLAEGDRISTKHLATVDRDITRSTLERMMVKNVIPVVPAGIIASSYPTASGYIWSVQDFVAHALRWQAKAERHLGYPLA